MQSPSSETRYSLRIETGERQGESLPLHEGLATLGRRSDNTFVLPSGSVSGHHAEIRVENGRVELSDLGSTNGTKVAGRKIESADLSHGDEITLGSFKMKLFDREELDTPVDGLDGDLEIELEGEDEIRLEPPPEPDEPELEEPRIEEARPRPKTTQPAELPGTGLDPALGGGGEMERVSADKVAASGTRSRFGLIGMGLLVAIAVAAGTWAWKQRQASAEGSGGPPIVEEPGNLLSGGTFETDAEELDWGSPATAQGFLRERKFARTGRVGFGVELEEGEWALSRSPAIRLPSQASSKGLLLKGSLRSTGSAEGRLGVEFALDPASDPAAGVFVWAPAVASSVEQFGDCEMRLRVPAGHRIARVVVAARGAGEVALDDVGLFEVERDPSLDASFNEIGLHVLGEGASTASLVRAGRAVLPSLQLGRWDARGLVGTGSGSWRVESGERGFEVQFDGAPGRLTILVSDGGIDLGSDDQAWIATLGEEGYRDHALQFERERARSVLLGRGAELLRLGFPEDVDVRGESHPLGLMLSIALHGARSMEVQLSFVAERTEATVLASRADDAERRGRVGEALVAWSKLLDEFPIDRTQVSRAEEARAQLVGEGLDDVAEVRAAFERARFFALPELYRQGRERCRELAERYTGSEVEAEARRLDAEIAGELAQESAGGLAQESELLEDVLGALDPEGQPRLIDHLRRAIERRGGEEGPGETPAADGKEEGSDG